MQPSQWHDHFKRFPYRADCSDGRTNNGGIDLTEHPHRIDEISEAADFPALRCLLLGVNAPGRVYKTLGCEAGEEDGLFYGYVDFTPRNAETARNEAAIAAIDQQFDSWLSLPHRKHSPEVLASIRSNIAWEYAPFTYTGTMERCFYITVTYRAHNKEAAGQLVMLLQEFLQSDVP